jgi:hypothetical protein
LVPEVAEANSQDFWSPHPSAPAADIQVWLANSAGVFSPEQDWESSLCGAKRIKHQQNWPTRPEYQQQEQKDEGTKNPDCSPLRPLGPKRGHLEFSYLVIVLRAVYIQLLCLPDFCLIQSLHSIFQPRRQIDYIDRVIIA